jgi:L-asparaginase II
MPRDMFRPAVEITRGPLVESTHDAAIAVCDAGGRLLASLGDPERVIYMRSIAKPFQAAAVLATGAAERFGLIEREIALISSSHAGEPMHAETAASILSRCGLDPSALGCGTHPPFSRSAAENLLREGRRPDVLVNNCSGKHSGMLAAAKAMAQPTEGYLDPEHPVQRAVRAAVAAFTGRPEDQIAVAVDGCSAPTFAVTLGEAARAFARLIAAPGLETGGPALTRAAARVAAAMRSYPEMVSGDGMLDTILMRAIPGLVAKIGADGVHAIGWSGAGGPMGIAVKVMDGDSGRARAAVVLAALRQVGALNGSVTLPEAVTDLFTVRSLRGAAVGEVRPVFSLKRET